MTVKDVLCRMTDDILITIEDCKKGETLVDCDTCERICAFDDTDKELHNLLKSSVVKMEIGKVYGDLIISIFR